MTNQKMILFLIVIEKNEFMYISHVQTVINLLKDWLSSSQTVV